MKIIFTIDTEWDRVSDRSRLYTENLAVLAEVWKTFDGSGVKSCFLCAQEAAESADFETFVTPLLKTGEAEIGTHLHPWSTPRFTARNADGTVCRFGFPSEYPLDVFESKLDYLKNTLQQKYGAQSIYRAGRFGFKKEHVPILINHGYRIDTSVTPYQSWADVAGLNDKGGPDFSNYGPMPFLWSDGPSRTLLELPVTIVQPDRLNFKGRIKKLLGRGTGNNALWLRPLPGRLHLLKTVALQARASGVPVLTLFAHSNEFHHQANPYFTTRDSVRAMCESLREFFVWCGANGIEFCLPRDIDPDRYSLEAKAA